MPDSADKKSGCLGILFALLGQKQDDSADTNPEETPPFHGVDAVLSPAERSFYGVLDNVVDGQFRILIKVRLADLVKVNRGAESRQKWQNKVNQKHVDFVLCSTDTVAPELVIELDDASHQRQSRKDRDELVDQVLTAAGIPILHVKAASTYDPHAVIAAIKDKLGE